jgi:hypothetical protein
MQPDKDLICWEEIKTLEVVDERIEIIDVCWNVQVEVRHIANDL